MTPAEPPGIPPEAGGAGPAGVPPEAAPQPEHPLSVLLFAPLRTPQGHRAIVIGLSAICALLVILGFVVPLIAHNELERIPAFYAAFGFAAFALAVLSGWPLGRLLRRPEGFYETIARRKPAKERDDGE
ncbi:MAG: hypothetical protein R3C52_15275 [Hyphomonadaceae bacterium]